MQVYGDAWNGSETDFQASLAAAADAWCGYTLTQIPNYIWKITSSSIIQNLYVRVQKINAL